jgi:hypothetical protein
MPSRFRGGPLSARVPSSANRIPGFRSGLIFQAFMGMLLERQRVGVEERRDRMQGINRGAA